MNVRIFTYSTLFLLVLLGGAYAVAVYPVSGQALSAAERAQLEAEYAKLQEEIAEWEQVLKTTRAKKGSLQGDVTLLNAQIKQAEAQIRQKNLAISDLGTEIQKKSARINSLSSQIDRGRESLAQLLRKTNQINEYSIAEIVLSREGLSELLVDLDTFGEVKSALAQLFVEIREAKGIAEKEKEDLDEKKNQELDAKYVVESKKKTIAQSEAEKKRLLEITKNEEKNYEQVLTERQKRANEIRNALFALRDSAGISFQSALEYATFAEQQTGVRAAFILGILRQESNLGENVGQCLLTSIETGAGMGRNTGTAFKNVMHPTRDVPPFIDLMKRLGADPYATPVSCPQATGYGGAMGPSQFIASTWKLYENKLKTNLGVGTPDPWIARHAIMATSLFLKDLKADRQTYSAEREAAGRYYAGGNWQKSGLGYASSVLSHAEKYQADIDFLNGV
jgi:peptidoglycan hydrolase CwlO-like protein